MALQFAKLFEARACIGLSWQPHASGAHTDLPTLAFVEILGKDRHATLPLKVLKLSWRNSRDLGILNLHAL